MIVGGAQENTLFNCLDLIHHHGDSVRLVTGFSLGAEGELLAQSDTEGLDIEFIPSLIRSIHPKHDWVAYRELIRTIRSWKPDVVHTHSAKGGLLGRAAAWKCRVPCVVHTVHGAPFHPYQNRFSRHFFIACERWAARRCHHLISVADAMTQLMVDARVAPAEKFTTIYSGMNVEPFLESEVHREATRRELGLADDDILFGKIARLFHLKGHEFVIDAAKRVVERIPNAKFLFVGDGILKEELERRIESLGLMNRFLFTGLVPPREIPKLISAMDVLVHASLREGLARALPQGLIAGKPVISFDVDGAREVVLDGSTGCLIPPCDVGKLAEGMIELGESSEKRQRYGAEGRARFTDQFRHQQMTKEIRALYERVLGGRETTTNRTNLTIRFEG